MKARPIIREHSTVSAGLLPKLAAVVLTISFTTLIGIGLFPSSVFADDPYTVSLTITPPTITADGISTATLTATVQTGAGIPAPDGTQVTFSTSLGYLNNWTKSFTSTTANGVTYATLHSVPSGTDVTASVQAQALGDSDEKQVTFTAPACNADMSDWREQDANPIFGQGVSGGPKAYYPALLYSPTAFDGHGDQTYYKMWFGTSGSKTGYATSNDGINWTTQTTALATINGYHAFVVYDADQFGGHGDAAYYKMWYWDVSNSIHYATSNDGVNWTNHPGNPVITNTLGWGSAPVYDANVIYNSDGNPAYYEAWIDNNGKIYYITSADGVTWTGDNQELLTDRQSWEALTYSRVSVLKQDGTYYMWYGGSDSSGGNRGIGYAVSTDGVHWSKSADNPMLHIADGVGWRDNRSYTPRVLYDADGFSGHGPAAPYKMWFTGKDQESGNYAVGLATLRPATGITSISGDGQTGNAANPLDDPFVVQATDTCGQPATGAPLTFAVTGWPVTATLTGTLSVTNTVTITPSGLASSTLTLGDVDGIYTVTVQSPGLSIPPTEFTASAWLGYQATDKTIFLPMIFRSYSP
jgi:hypothetical protein